MKILIFTILFFFLSKLSISQTFETIYSSSIQQIPNSIIEIDGEYYIALESTKIPGGPTHGKVVRINKIGQITDSIVFDTYYNSSIKSLVQINDSLIGAYGYSFGSKTDSALILMYTLNHSLDIISSNDYKTNITDDYYITSRSYLRNDTIVHVLAFDPFPANNKIQGFHLFYLNSDAKLLNHELVINMDIFLCMVDCILPVTDSASFYLFSRHNIFKVDDQLNLVDTFIPEKIFKEDAYMFPPYHACWLDTSIVISGNESSGGDFTMMLNKMSNDFTSLEYKNFDGPDREYPANNYGISSYNNLMYLSGTSKFSMEVYGNESSIRIIKIDQNFEVVWDKYYKENDGYYYFAWSTLATNDGGCIITATRNQYNSNPNQLDLYLLKVDSLGNYTPLAVEEDKLSANKVSVFPNPGTSELNISFSGIGQAAVFTLYSIAGQKVMSQTLETEQTQIATRQLPNGLYVYELSQNGETVDRGKWVKR